MSKVREVNKVTLVILAVIALLLANMICVKANEAYFPKDMYAVSTVDVLGEDSSKIGYFVKDEKVVVTGVSEDDTLYSVDYNGKVGFIVKEGVSCEKPEYVVTNMGGKTMYVTTGLKFRLTPNSESEIYRSLMKNEKVKVVASVDDTVYYRVVCGDVEGYVNKNYLTADKPDFVLTVMDKTLYCKESTKLRVKPDSSSKAKTTIIPKEKVKVLAKVNGKNRYKVECRGKVGYVYSKNFSSKKPSFVVTAKTKTIYSTKTVKLRKGPGKSYDAKDTITPREKLKMTAKVVGKDWYQVKYGKKTGYVYSKSFSTKKPSFTVKKMNKSKYTNTSVNIRKGPSTKYGKLYTVSKNTKVKVTGDVVNSKWYRVSYKGKTGYIQGKYLSNTKVNYTIIGTYKDKTGKVTVYKEWYKNAWVYAAHLEFSDYKRFGTSCANGAYGNGYELIQNADSRLGSILTVNGCYSAPYLNYGVVRSGKVWNDKACYVPAIYSRKDGKLKCAWEVGGIPEVTGQQLSTLAKSGKVSDTFCFGPPILGNGDIDDLDDTSRAQRTFIGTNGEAGDIWVCVSDGRYVDGVSPGLRYKEAAQYLKSKGCVFGVPLDGGGSSTMMFKGKVLNATSGRAVVDFVYFR